MDRQITQYHLCDALWSMGLADSVDEAKQLCIQGAITVNGVVERDFNRGVSYRDEIRKGE